MAPSLTSRKALLLAASISTSLTPVLAQNTTTASMSVDINTEGCHAANPLYTNDAFAASCLHLTSASEASASAAMMSMATMATMTSVAATTTTGTFNILTETVGCHAGNTLYENPTFAAHCFSVATAYKATETDGPAPAAKTTATATAAMPVFTGAAVRRGAGVEAAAAAAAAGVLGLVGVALL